MRPREAETARQVAIDWYGLETALVRRRDDSLTYLDTRSGEIVYLTQGWSDDHGFSEDDLDEGLVSGRLVPVEPLPPETGRDWMRSFAEALEDGWARDFLMDALAGARPVSRFEETLGRFPQERLAWLACQRSRTRAVLRAWLEANDVEPTTAPAGPAEGELAG